MTAALEINHISKAFFGIKAVDDVTLSANSGEILGLIGQNGAGKSTLMNLIGGVVIPDTGEMTLGGKPYTPHSPIDAYHAGIAFIHQELNLFTNLTIAENLFITGFPRKGILRGIDRGAMRQRAKTLLDSVGLDIPPDLPVERISPGERQLVEIAKALHQNAALIIFDEPTTSLTARETEKLFAIMRQLREQGKAVLYISHTLEDVLRLSDRIAVMRDGKLMAWDSVDKFDIARMIALMVGRNLEQLYPPRTASPTREVIMNVEGVTSAGIVEDINFNIRQGEVVGLFGLMGSGRTELARIIFGVDPFETGSITINGKRVGGKSPQHSIRNGVSFVTENRREEGLLMSIDIMNNIGMVAMPRYARAGQVIDTAGLHDAAQRTAEALQLKSGAIETATAKSLSGGNQQKVVIAKWLLAEPTVFIMDEPTRGIDVGAKYEIYSIVDQLAANGSAILMISSELEELMGMCDRILVMSQGEIVASFERDQFDDETILRAAFRESEAVKEAGVS